MVRRVVWAAALALVLSAEPREPSGSEGLDMALAECQNATEVGESYPVDCACLKACVADEDTNPEDCIGLCD